MTDTFTHMFLIARPPTLRWAAAVLLVLAGLWADLRPEGTVEHPFATSDLASGQQVTSADVDMIEVPPGVFEPVAIPLTLARPVAAGEPVLASSLSVDAIAIPDGWLVIELAVPNGAHPGSDVVAVISEFESDLPTAVEGLVLTAGVADGFGATLASCAFPGDEAGLVAVAAAENRLTVLTGS